MIQTEITNPQNADQLKYWLELASFASNPILVLIAAFALRQITLAKRAIEIAKRDIETRTKREATILAGEKIEGFARDTFPLLNQLKQGMANRNVEMRNWELLNYKFDNSSLKAEDMEGAKEWLNHFKAELDLYNQALQTLNSLEAFSIYFANGAADELIAYPPLASSFCKCVRWLSPLLIALRATTPEDDLKGRYQNTTILFEKWMLRIKKESLKAKSNIINKEMLSIDDSSLPLIGLEK